MPNLQQQITLCQSKTAFSRSDDEVIAALQESGLYIFQQVLKENSGQFLKFDTTSVAFVPGQQTYTLPADCDQIVHLAERQSASNPWLPMSPEPLADSITYAQGLFPWWDQFAADYYGYDSAFSYYGPYLTSAAAVSATKQQSINVSPAIDVARMCEIVYTARWIPLVNSQSKVMLPDEAQPCMTSYAIAELLRSDDDTLAVQYEARGDKQLTSFLTQVRARQTQRPQRITPYLG